MRIDSPRRRQHLDAVAKRLPEHVARLSWSAERLKAERQSKLRETLSYAAEMSPWHRQRLLGIDFETFTEDNLSSLPTMTKADVMSNWDRVVTDSRLTLADANANITAKLRGETTDYYILDEYEVYATGGSSGTRGVFVWGWDEFIEIACSAFRYQMRDEPPESSTGRRLLAVVEAGEIVHGSPVLFSVSIDPDEDIRWFPADTPIGELVSELNEAQPTHINGFSSAVEQLAGEALAGRLSISPRRVTTNSEPLLAEAREAVRKAWGIGVNNMWGSVEVGLLGVECDAFNGMHWSDDLAITELVDHDNRPTTDPDRIDKVLVTSLFCRTMPMIRYELTDVAIPRTKPCSCGAVYPLISEIRGRSDDAFKYGDVSIHPMVFRTPLGQHPMIEQYQVHQTPNGARITVIARGDVDVAQLQTDIVSALESRGLVNPDVVIVLADALERHKETGKMKRFIPLRA